MTQPLAATLKMSSKWEEVGGVVEDPKEDQDQEIAEEEEEEENEIVEEEEETTATVEDSSRVPIPPKGTAKLKSKAKAKSAVRRVARKKVAFRDQSQ